MRETNRSTTLVGLLLTSALHGVGAVKTSEPKEQVRNGSRTRSSPMRRTTDQPSSLASGSGGYEATPYVTPTRVLVPRRHCLTPPPPPEEGEVEAEGAPRFGYGRGESSLGESLEQREGMVVPLLDLQSKAGLFKLPIELRVWIYEQVLGGRVLKIVGGLEGKLQCLVVESGEGNPREKDNELGSSVVKHTSWLSGLDSGGEDEASDDGRQSINERKGERVKFLPVLQSCRGIYLDAMPILYSSNTFSFTTMESFIAFSRAIPPRRFDSIRHLTIDFRYDLSSPTGFSVADSDNATPRSNWPRWERTWRVIDTMAKLQSLIVRIEWGKQLFASEEERLLGPLCGVRALETFEVEVGPLRRGEKGRLKRDEKWGFKGNPKAYEEKRVKEVPFRLVRRDG